MEERMRDAVARFLRERQGLRDMALRLRESDARLAEPAAPAARDISVCAVDSGVLHERMHGTDIIVGRAAAVHFRHSSSGLSSAEHFPSRLPEQQHLFESCLDEREALLSKSLFRLNMEITLAIECAQKFSPDFLLLDGSIVPLASDRPAKSSALHSRYAELASAYGRLFSLCSEKNIQLCGVAKDSRATRLASMLGVRKVPDTVLASHILRAGERTSEFQYAGEPEKHAVLHDFGRFASRIRAFYLKPSETDLPLRVEFLQQEKSAGEIASALHQLSSISETFAYPAALIEADMCAAMESMEIDRLKKQLHMLSGGAMENLRRNSRPFR